MQVLLQADADPNLRNSASNPGSPLAWTAGAQSVCCIRQHENGLLKRSGNRHGDASSLKALLLQ